MNQPGDPDRRIGWPELIGVLAQRRIELDELDPRRYPMTAPGLGAAPAALDAAEARLGHALDPQHRELLSFADGWSGVLLDVRLLATAELGEGELWAHGRMLLDTFFADGAVPPDFPAREELMPFAVGTEQPDLHVLWLTGPTTEGARPVLWLAGEEIDRWPHLEEYFRSMIAYNERLLQRARG